MSAKSKPFSTIFRPYRVDRDDSGIGPIYFTIKLGLIVCFIFIIYSCTKILEYLCHKLKNDFIISDSKVKIKISHLYPSK